MPVPPEQQPQLIVYEDTPTTIRERVQYIGEQLCGNPVLYGMTLSQLGEEATRGSVRYTENVEAVSSIGATPAALLKEFFSQRYDTYCDFDQTTTQRLESSAMYKQLLADALNKGPRRYKTGTMSSEYRPHEDAPSSRDRLRRYRMAMFIELNRQHVAVQPFSGSREHNMLAS